MSSGSERSKIWHAFRRALVAGVREQESWNTVHMQYEGEINIE